MRPQVRRRERITVLVHEHGFISIKQLARELGVTPQTIRRGIGTLSAENVLRRYHGSTALDEALLGGESGQGGRHSRREEKDAIAQLVATHTPDNTSLFINIGTTVKAVATTLIRQRKNLRITTNNTYVAALASTHSGYTVIITSGIVCPLGGDVTDAATVDFINQLGVGYIVLSTHGAEGDDSLLDYDYREVGVTQTMMVNARVRFLGVNHSKFQLHVLVWLGDITNFDRVFTDRTPNGEMQEIPAAAGMEWSVPEICQHAAGIAEDEKWNCGLRQPTPICTKYAPPPSITGWETGQNQ